MKYNQVHVKSVIPAGEYEFTITQAYPVEGDKGDRVAFCHTINTGPHAYSHIIDKYPLKGSGLGRLRRMCQALNHVWIGDTTDPDFLEQFIGLRGVMTTTLTSDDSTIRPVILDWQVSMRRPEYDVTKEKTEEFFFQSKKPKPLPF